MKYSVCVPAVLGGMEIEEALNAIREAGFDQYEFWGWWDPNQDMDQYLAVQKKYELTPAALCTRFVPLTDPAQRGAYVKGLQETIDVCKKLGCKTIISQVGNDLAGKTREEQHASIVAGLKECVSMLEESGVMLVIEPLNTKIDHAGYYMWSSEEAYQVVDEVGSKNIKVLFDLYHQYIMDDLDMEKILANMDKIAHFHMAGYPGRHEPLIDSEIDYPVILKKIRESGYQGSVGLEYFPVQDAAEGLKLLNQQLKEF